MKLWIWNNLCKNNFYKKTCQLNLPLLNVFSESVGYLSQSLDNLNTKSQNDLTNKPTTSLKKSSQNRWKSTSDIYTSIKGDGDESFAGGMYSFFFFL